MVKEITSPIADIPSSTTTAVAIPVLLSSLDSASEFAVIKHRKHNQLLGIN